MWYILKKKDESAMDFRKKLIFPAVCDYLRSFNPFPNRNFNDVYADFIKEKMNNPNFDTTRLSKWIQGNRSDLLKNPVYIDFTVRFIEETFLLKNIDPEPIATDVRTEFVNSSNVFYHFTKEHEKLYAKRAYVKYLVRLIIDETHMYNKVMSPEKGTVPATGSGEKANSFAGYLKKKKAKLGIAILSVVAVCLAVYAVLVIARLNLNTAPPMKISVYGKLPEEGQLILPKGIYFQIQPNMRGNARAFNEQDTLEKIIVFSSGVSRDRAKLFKKSIKDFPTVIWENPEEPYDKQIIMLRPYPENNTIENLRGPMTMHSEDNIIMFEYSIGDEVRAQ